MIKVSNKPITLMITGFILLFSASLFGDNVMADGENKIEIAKSVDKTDAVSQNMSFLNYDMVLGNKNAPIEIIEYGSLSCPHCAHFHEEVFLPLKKHYLDTGKVKFIYRHYMRNVYDLDASHITLCLPENKFFEMIGLLFKHQRNLVNSKAYRKFYREADNKKAAIEKYREFTRGELAKIAHMVGMSRTDFDICLANDKIPDYLFNVHKEGVVKYEVSGTPTVFVNGKRLRVRDFETLEEAIQEVE